MKSDFLTLHKHAIFSEAIDPDAVIPMVFGRNKIEIKKLNANVWIIGQGDLTIHGVYNEKNQSVLGWYKKTDFNNASNVQITIIVLSSPENTLFADVSGEYTTAFDLVKLLTQWDNIQLDSASDILDVQINAVFSEDNTYRFWLDKLSENIGAVFTGSIESLPCIFPLPLKHGVPTIEISHINAVSFDWAVSLRDVFNFFTVAFSGGALSVHNQQSISQFGLQKKEIDATWLPSASSAFELASRLCDWQSQLHCVITIECDSEYEVNIGDTVSIAHTCIPVVSGVVTSSMATLSGSVQLTIDCVASAIGKSELVAKSLVITDGVAVTSNEITAKAGYTVFTILGANGQPLSNANVILDGVTIKTTNEKGQVQFKNGIKGKPFFIEAYLKGFTPVFYSGEW